jgi:hypothetical protein
MNKFKFRIKNYLLMARFARKYRLSKIEYPDIIQFLDNKYGTPLLIDDFHTLDNWQITDRGNWGSARPDNLCTYVKENVALQEDNGKHSLVINTTPDEATGKDWNGNDVTKPMSSGLVTSTFLVRPGQVVSATVNTSQSYAGSWFAFWLFKKGIEGDERYREVDIFEKFMEKDFQKKYTMTVHGGTGEKREMMNFQYPLFYVNEDKMTFTCEFYQHKIRVFINGILIFLAEEPDFDGEYQVIFDDAPTTHGGKVRKEDIFSVLPRSLEVVDFRVYKM